jgi:hypothetical protein
MRRRPKPCRSGNGIQAALLACGQHPLAGNDEGRRAQRDIAFIGHRPDLIEGADHDVFEAAVDLLFAPEKAGEVLHPLEIRHRDAAGIGQHIRHHQDAALTQNIVGGRRGRAIGTLDDDARLDRGGPLGKDLSFKRSRHQVVRRQQPEVVDRNRRRPRKTAEPAIAGDVGERGMDVDAGFVGKGRRMILQGNNDAPASWNMRARCRRRCQSPERRRARP